MNVTSEEQETKIEELLLELESASNLMRGIAAFGPVPTSVAITLVSKADVIDAIIERYTS